MTAVIGLLALILLALLSPGAARTFITWFTVTIVVLVLIAIANAPS